MFRPALDQHGVKPECPRCDATGWAVLEGDYAFVKVDHNPISDDPRSTGGIPCAVSVCRGCGFVAMHAIGALDL